MNSFSHSFIHFLSVLISSLVSVFLRHTIFPIIWNMCPRKCFYRFATLLPAKGGNSFDQYYWWNNVAENQKNEGLFFVKRQMSSISGMTHNIPAKLYCWFSSGFFLFLSRSTLVRSFQTTWSTHSKRKTVNVCLSVVNQCEPKGRKIQFTLHRLTPETSHELICTLLRLCSKIMQ